jgi:hypothetical protein
MEPGYHIRQFSVAGNTILQTASIIKTRDLFGSWFWSSINELPLAGRV